MAVLLIITSEQVLENYAMEGRRIREQQTIWAGEQIERGIKLYYKKTGHYPQTFDDLQSGLAELHFVREEAIKNPMNKTDGTWRFIYVNAAGQIIGSVKYATLQQMAIMDLNHGKIPPVAPGAVSASSLAAASNASGNNSAAAAAGNSTAGSNSSTQSSSQSGASSGNDDSGQLQNPLAALKPTGPVDGPVPGAFLTGVGCKTDAKSLIFYHGGKKYLDWEFIWNPIEDQARAMQAQANGATGAGGLIPGLTNLPGLPTGLTGTGTSSTGTSATPTAPSTTSPATPAQPSSPGSQTPPNAPQQNSDQ